jgi:hypothetical protein
LTAFLDALHDLNDLHQDIHAGDVDLVYVQVELPCGLEHMTS